MVTKNGPTVDGENVEEIEEGMKPVHKKKQNKPDLLDPRRHPPRIVRSVVFIQSCLRRKEFWKSFGSSDAIAELAPPQPSLALALYMCRRLRSPEWVNIEREAMAVAGILSEKENGLTIRMLSDVLLAYSYLLAEGHPSLELLQEKLHATVVELHEDLLNRIRPLTTPRQIRRAIDLVAKSWDIPPIMRHECLDVAEDVLLAVAQRLEEVMGERVKHCRSVRAIKRVEEEVEREFGPTDTKLRSDMAKAKQLRREFMEWELTTRWEWPFKGSLLPYLRACRVYLEELGRSNRLVAEFVDGVVQLWDQYSSESEAELSVLQAQIAELTEKAEKSRTKVFMQAYENQRAAKLTEACARLQHWRSHLGPEDLRVFSYAKAILRPERLEGIYLEELELCSAELRECGQGKGAPEIPKDWEIRRPVSPKDTTEEEGKNEVPPEELDPAAKVTTERLQFILEVLLEVGKILEAQEDPEGKLKERQAPAREAEARSEFAHALYLLRQTPPETFSLHSLRSTQAEVAPVIVDEVSPLEEVHDPWAPPSGFEVVIQTKGGRQVKDSTTDPKEESHNQTLELLREFERNAAPWEMPPRPEKEEPDEELLKIMEATKAEPLTVQLMLQEMHMDDLAMQAEEVISEKFRVAIAKASGVSKDRIRMVGFKNVGNG